MISKLLIALSGWIIFCLYILYDYKLYGSYLLEHLLEASSLFPEMTFHALVFFCPVLTTSVSYLVHQREREIRQRIQVEQELRQHQEHLEELVGQQTSELSSALEKLKKEVEERKNYEKELTDSREELKKLAAHIQSAREEERGRVATEIHDDLGQALTALNMDLSWLAGKVQTLLLEKTGSMSALVNKTIKTVQRISSELRPGLLDTLGLVAACEYEAGKYRDMLDITVDSALYLDDKVLGQELSVALYRIVQEALTNVVRHAEATAVRVRLKEDAHHVILSVRDNGRGITEEQTVKSDSFGLLGMRERAAMFGGSVDIVGTDGAGTAITVRVPVHVE